MDSSANQCLPLQNVKMKEEIFDDTEILYRIEGGATCLLFSDKHWQGVGVGVREGTLLPINSFDVSESVGQQRASFGRYGVRDRSPKLILLQASKHHLEVKC